MQTEELKEKIMEVESNVNYYLPGSKWKTEVVFKNEITLMQYRPVLLSLVGDIMDAAIRAQTVGYPPYHTSILAPSSPLATYLSLKNLVRVVDYNRENFYSEEFINYNLGHVGEGAVGDIIYWTITDTYEVASEIRDFDRHIEIDTVYVAFSLSDKGLNIFKEKLEGIKVVHLFDVGESCTFNEVVARWMNS